MHQISLAWLINTSVPPRGWTGHLMISNLPNYSTDVWNPMMSGLMATKKYHGLIDPVSTVCSVNRGSAFVFCQFFDQTSQLFLPLHFEQQLFLDLFQLFK